MCIPCKNGTPNSGLVGDVVVAAVVASSLSLSVVDSSERANSGEAEDSGGGAIMGGIIIKCSLGGATTSK